MKKLILSKFLVITGILNAVSSPDISIKELINSIEAKQVTIIDVNGPNSYNNGHIPGAIHFSKNKTILKDLLPMDKNTLIVAYCGGPSCKAYLKGINAAAKLGYKNLRHLSAGISGWKKAGQKTSKK